MSPFSLPGSEAELLLWRCCRLWRLHVHVCSFKMFFCSLRFCLFLSVHVSHCLVLLLSELINVSVEKALKRLSIVSLLSPISWTSFGFSRMHAWVTYWAISIFVCPHSLSLTPIYNPFRGPQPPSATGLQHLKFQPLIETDCLWDQNRSMLCVARSREAKKRGKYNHSACQICTQAFQKSHAASFMWGYSFIAPLPETVGTVLSLREWMRVIFSPLLPPVRDESVTMPWFILLFFILSLSSSCPCAVPDQALHRWICLERK